MFERLAYYGAKSILILFLITTVAKGGLGIGAEEATIITANLIAYTAIAPIIGGVISDRWIGARYLVTVGLGMMTIGYGIAWQAQNITMVYGMIILVAIGSGLFKGNLNALIGCQFEEQTVLDEAFSVQYSYLNIGTFLGSLITGYLYLHVFSQGDILGFRQCFLIASSFCLIGLVWFIGNWKNLQGYGLEPYKLLEKENKEITKVERKHIVAIVIVAILSVIFWIFYFQQDLALVIYMTEYVDMQIGAFVIPTSWVSASWNGLLCIILGGVMANIWKKLALRPEGDMSIFGKIGWSFAFLGGAFGLMVICEFTRQNIGNDAGNVSVIWPLIFVTFLTVGEMCFSPLRNALVSKYAPKKYLSLLMGIIASSSFFANKISPYIQSVITKYDVYTVFKGIFFLLIMVTISISFSQHYLSRLLIDENV